MLLQTNSYIVPKDKRTEHARLVIRFKQTLARLGCDHFEAYEQVGANWSPTEATGRFVQIMRFRDRKHQQQVQAAERSDPGAQALIKEFCELINFPYQQQQGLFAVGFYSSILPGPSPRVPPQPPQHAPQPQFSPAAPGAARGENGPVMVPPPPPPVAPAAHDEAPAHHAPAFEQQQMMGPETIAPNADEPRLSPEHESQANSEPNGEFNIDEFIEEEARQKGPEKDSSSDRAMQYEP